VQRDPVREAEEPAAPVETPALNVESPVTAGVSSATTVALNGGESKTGGVEPRVNGTNGILLG
jgi:hypothetical protein